MLFGIPSIISPELMKILMEMGHGDELVLADGNFPAVSCAQRLVRADGHRIIDFLEAVLPLFPLDYAVKQPCAVMSLLPGQETPVVWQTYGDTIERLSGNFAGLEYIDRFDFYERAKKAFAVVITSDTAFKGNLILKKGVVRP
ncbi:RbsD/FucU family protein [Paenibacillus sp. BC26]|uniref:RbsD/FucU family protein n=1 Tax=Paenibacillus sp. BC26 TaxID=1881032 RepID=UPI0008E53BDE|nr:RbsD/FucU domain-containing protein [Paenibacillus sp. BC26]SFS74225.1 L-fucose mutarotase [Paenibacillus sp. BC26]